MAEEVAAERWNGPQIFRNEGGQGAVRERSPGKCQVVEEGSNVGIILVALIPDCRSSAISKVTADSGGFAVAGGCGYPNQRTGCQMIQSREYLLTRISLRHGRHRDFRHPSGRRHAGQSSGIAKSINMVALHNPPTPCFEFFPTKR